MKADEYNPDRPLDYSVIDYLLNRIEERRNEIAWYLDFKGIDWDQVICAADKIADAIMKCVEDIGADSTFAKLIEVLDDEEPKISDGVEKIRYVVLMEAIEEALARRVIEALVCAKERIIKLLQISKKVEGSVRVRDFLSRVSRTYLLGFDPECIVMCRGALEAQFDAEISNDDCICKLKRTVNASHEKPTFDLRKKIEVALTLGKITPDIGNSAHKVRKAGNKVVHRSPASDCDATTILKHTVAVIKALGNYRKNVSESE